MLSKAGMELSHEVCLNGNIILIYEKPGSILVWRGKRNPFFLFVFFFLFLFFCDVKLIAGQ